MEGHVRLISTASAAAWCRTIRLVPVTIPFRWACTTPRLTPALCPKSSATTMRRRSSVIDLRSQTQLVEHLSQHRLGLEVLLGDGPRGVAVALVIGVDGFDGGQDVFRFVE